MRSRKELVDRFSPISEERHHFVLDECGAFEPVKRWEFCDGHLFYSENTTERSRLTCDDLDQLVLLESLLSLFRSWDFLSVWNWRNDYSLPTADGMSWKLTGEIGGNEIDAAGRNAFPSFASVEESSENPERYSLMFCSILNAFCVPIDNPWWHSLAAS